MRGWIAAAAAAVLLVPATPAAAEPAEAAVTGTVELTVSEDAGGSAEHAAVRVGDVDLPVPRAMVGHLATGSTAEVTVRAAGEATGAAALAGAVRAGTAAVTGVRGVAGTGAADGDPSGHALAGAAAAGPRTHEVTMVPLYWATPAVPAGEPTVAELTQSIADVDSYYADVTGGALRVAANRVLPWQKVALPAGSGCGDATTFLRNEALRLAGGVTASPLHHLVMYFPAGSGCLWGGLATIGPTWGSYGTIWLNSYRHVAVFAHELGHNLGLHHSAALRCTAGGAPVTLSDTCTVAHYDDPWDIMGSSPYGQVGHLSSARLTQLGLMPDGGHQAAAPGEQVQLAPVGADTGVRHASVAVGTATYHLEYRTPTGRDAWIDDQLYSGGGPGAGQRYPGGGLVVRRVDSALGADAQTYAVLDFHPAWAADVRGLGVGETWLAPGGGLGFRVDAAGPAAATVTVLRPEDISGPAVAVNSPAANAELGGSFTVTWTASDPGSGIDKAVVELDGAPVKEVTRGAWGMPSSTYLDAVPDGVHELRVRAFDGVGNGALSAPVEVDVDGVLPSVLPAPQPALTRGTVSAASVPVAVQWGAADGNGVCGQIVTRIPGVSSWPAAGTRALTGTLRPGEATRWSLMAQDCRGNSVVRAGAATVAAVDPQSAARGYRGRWSAARHRAHYGGTELVTGAAGASFSYTVTARAIGWVATTGPTRGRAVVYVDGRRAGIVDLYSRRAYYRQQVYSRTWPTAGRHTVTVVASPYGARRVVGVDAVSRLS